MVAARHFEDALSLTRRSVTMPAEETIHGHSEEARPMEAESPRTAGDEFRVAEQGPGQEAAAQQSFVHDAAAQAAASIRAHVGTLNK